MRARNVATFFAVLLAGSAPNAFAQINDSYGALLVKQGEAAAEVGDWRAAAGLLTQAAQSQKWKSRALYDLGIADYHLGAFSQAIAAEKAAIQCDEHLVSAYIQLATISIRCSDYAAAEAALKKAVQIDPQSKLAKANLEHVHAMYLAANKAAVKTEKIAQAGKPPVASEKSELGKKQSQTIAAVPADADAEVFAKIVALHSAENQLNTKPAPPANPEVVPVNDESGSKIATIAKLEETTKKVEIDSVKDESASKVATVSKLEEPTKTAEIDSVKSESGNKVATSADLQAVSSKLAVKLPKVTSAHPASGQVDQAKAAEMVSAPVIAGLADKADELLVQASAVFNKGDVDKAKCMLKRAVNLDAQNLFAHINLGVLLGLQADFSGDAQEQTAAIQIEPKNQAAHYNLAWAMTQEGKYPEALAQFDQVLSLNNNFSDAIANKAFVLSKMGQTQKAIDMLVAAKTQFGKSAWPCVALSRVYINESLNEEAAAELKEATERDPESLDAQKQLALLELGNSQWKAAVRLYEQTIRKTPYDLDAFISMASAQNASEDHQGAIGSLRKAIALAPSNAVAHASLSTALEIAGQGPEAEYEASVALKLNPKQQVAETVMQRILH